MGDSVEPTGEHEHIRSQDAWARLRFSIVGPLLAAPPGHGELDREIAKLAAKEWRHPITAEPIRFGPSTIERWYYLARNASVDPVGELRRRVRKDAGLQPAMKDQLKVALRAQYADHRSWTYQLHYDNLEALVAGDGDLGPLPSYSTVRRYMKTQGLARQRRRKGQQDRVRVEPREVRSYQAEYVHGLWHTDFHDGSRHVLTREGKWVKPQLFATLDDRSRLCCHAQWYLDEQTESFVHGLCQGFQKRGLPRALMSDNGSAMRAAETQQGLDDLGILWQPTLPYSPHQNAKQEVFWASVEGRLMAMLERQDELTLALLNEATQAWVELDYNHKPHSEIGVAPIRRFLDDKGVGRDSPGSEALRRAFRAEIKRQQRKSDATISIGGQRYEIPHYYSSLESVCVRVARWDMSFMHMVDERTGDVLCQIFPLDKERNAEGIRRTTESIDAGIAPCSEPAGIAPLLKKLMADYSATGLPPAYLPKHDVEDDAGDDA